MRASFLKYIVLIISFLFTANILSGQTIVFKWGAEDEKSVRGMVEREIKNQPFSASEKLRFVNCVMGKLKSRFPAGVKMEQSKLLAIKNQYVIECAQNVVHTEVKQWNSGTESELSKTFFAKIPATVDTATRTRLANCVVEKMKQKFPSGFVIKEGNKKQMDALLKEMTMKCMEMINYKGFLRWIPETEDEFVRQIQKYLPDEMPQDVKLSYINCLKEKLKAKYPDGISFTPETQNEFEALVEVLVKECDK
jgi:hypothetical protein